MDEALPLTDEQCRHLFRVLRLNPGEPIEYTDGSGISGEGIVGDQEIMRGSEQAVARPRFVAVYLAPPRAKERQRFAVEKLVELGVATIGWLDTAHGEGRPVSHEKALAWTIAALEQSRGAWLPTLRSGVTIAEVVAGSDCVIAADRGGQQEPPAAEEISLLIGPEAGWKAGELPDAMKRISLADTVLRTETAAVVGAARLLYA